MCAVFGESGTAGITGMSENLVNILEPSHWREGFSLLLCVWLCGLYETFLFKLLIMLSNLIQTEEMGCLELHNVALLNSL